MRKKQKKPGFSIRWNEIPFHLLLVSVFPVIFLYSVNAKDMNPMDTVPSLLVCITGAAVLFVLLMAVLRNAVKAGLTAIVVAVWFFSYGQVYKALNGVLKFNFHLVLLPVTAAMAGSLVFLIIKSGKKSGARLLEINQWANYIAGALVFYSLMNSGMSIVNNERNNSVLQLVKETSHTPPRPGTENYPDIYYIILDGHARSDYMRSIFNYDDTFFIEGLKKLGFYIPEKARTNYPESLLSFSSFLNYDYLDKLNRLDPESDNRTILDDDMKKSRIVDYLKSKGYTYNVFTSMEFPQDLTARADHVFKPAGINLTEFGHIFFDTTALSSLHAFTAKKEPEAYAARRKRIRFVLSNFSETARINSPKFVFAHILAPHPPFVLDENGNDVTSTKPISFRDGDHAAWRKGEYEKGYAGQVKYIDKAILQTVTDLMKKMKPGSIIIIHGDHGSGSGLHWENMEKTNLGERMSIFSAYYLPNGGDKDLRPDISPVNNFRMILKNYFGEKIDLLPDRSYFSLWSKPYKFYDVTDKTK